MAVLGGTSATPFPPQPEGVNPTFPAFLASGTAWWGRAMGAPRGNGETEPFDMDTGCSCSSVCFAFACVCYCSPWAC